MIIGILTFHLPTNFGANLQAFASSRYFASLGHVVYVLNYARPGDLNNVRKTGDVQKMAHQGFVEKRLPLTRKITSPEELRVLVKELKIELLVVGADAVWRQPQPKDNGVFFGQWVFDDPELKNLAVVSMSPAHMGDGFKQLDEGKRNAIAECLRQFRYITVRDEWTRHVINRDLFDWAPFVERINPDPVFTLSLDETDEWKSAGQKPKGYVAVTLPKDWTSNRRTWIRRSIWFMGLKRQAHRRGLQLVELPLPEGKSGLKFDYTLPYPIDPIQWFLWLKNAKYFIGLRFHAIVSCCANGTPFFSFDSYTGKGQPERSKIYNLLKGSFFESYRTDDITGISPSKLMSKLDNVNPEDVLDFRDSKRQLFETNMKQMFAVVEGKARKIELLGDPCTSCFACYNVCPKQAITMTEDAEGFYVPRVDYDKCIDCGLCDKSCPQMNEHEYVTTQRAWYGYQKDDEERKASSSGGIFGALAIKVLQDGGVVYGAAFNYGDQVLRLECRSTDEVDLAALKKSKYVQSYVGDAFKRIKRDLEQGRKVFFCGTPCQVDGLRQVLNKDHENLLTADFVCHGVPPMSLLRDHLHMLGFKTVTEIDFRPKNHRWVDDINIKNGASRRNYTNYWGNDAYFGSFEKARSTHRSCGNCQYCNGLRVTDITLADFWGYKDYDKSIYSPLGLSLILTNTEKGIKTVEMLGNECYLKEIDIKYSEYVYSRKRGGGTEGYYDMKQRNRFFAELQVFGYLKLVNRRQLQKKPQILTSLLKKKIKLLLPVRR